MKKKSCIKSITRQFIKTSMKKWVALPLISFSLITFFANSVYADDGGDMGIFGGISEGKNLPYTIDKYVDSGIKEDNEFEYKEVVFISGEPVEFKGTITVEKDDEDIMEESLGTYDETYEIEAVHAETGAELERTIEFTTSYRIIEKDFKKQIVRNSLVTGWDETITIDDIEYTLDEDASSFSKSSVEDLTPGVSYYDTVVDYNAEYISSEDEEIIISVYGSIVGYTQPWSKVESQNLRMDISRDGGESIDMTIQLNPFSKSKKTLYFDQTEPYPISFVGTYNQRLERESYVTYSVLTTHHDLTASQKKGTSVIVSANQVEKLPIPTNLDFLEGHWAEDDIKKLYSMEIFTQEPREGMQVEAMTRGEFVKALCISMDIDTSKYEELEEPETIFADVPPEHPLYPYIMAAYDAKLVKGVGQKFNVSVPITREEAFVIYIRVIGLERLGVSNQPMTPFVDDAEISSWARKEIMAGYNLGIIEGTAEGKVLPQKWISKAEAAAIINRLINYLREEISEDYQ